ncbi:MULTISPECIES: DUF4440 domain-containing protein [unclassified Ensifer]|uniref:nuclear transport factor 2 family protein n=1 Tax=unclassified Ensifer TaxID=2633371 RepID=UPI000813CA6B|nr:MULTISPECIES: DUF4440 domain-containing protein [unclassified Ensifer]OCO98883.1 DUF4440 domain-containing protein [Ensifer sp. LC14]OCP04416.1 DUF4440 domain-containing protein [Ensifer sp. LC11]OCP04697.1 DUF4440 domain-containing protein [Ensifer sp. LC13]OCP30521.1 DUF4440 domain-containing protein [Ensifer sp. LC499]
MTNTLPDLADIRALEEALHRPEVRGSRAALEDLLAEGFVEFGASDTVYHRAEIIDLLVQEDDADDAELRTGDYRLTPISSDAVSLTYRTHRIETDGSERHALRSSIWKWSGTRWQMLFHQGTITKPFAYD